MRRQKMTCLKWPWSFPSPSPLARVTSPSPTRNLTPAPARGRRSHQVRSGESREEKKSVLWGKLLNPLKKVVEASDSEESCSNINSVHFQCFQCDLSSKAEEDLNAHIGYEHSAPVLPTHKMSVLRLLNFFLHLFLDREKKVAPCHRLLLLCLWSVICSRAPQDIQEVHVKRLSLVKMILESMFI